MDKPVIKIPKTKIVPLNMRLFCLQVRGTYKQQGRIWLPDSGSAVDKSGKTQIIPRFYVVITAPDLIFPGEIRKGLPPGTQVLPFIPPNITDAHFPFIIDPNNGRTYYQFEWMEIGAILYPEEQKEKLWELE
jgi:hypothetical protein